MKRLLVLTLMPLLLAMAGGPAPAREPEAVRATRLLAMARAADHRCGLLDGTRRAELAGYARQAEIAAATQVSATAARTALAAGRAEGDAAACDAAADTVNATLEAARVAVAALRPGAAVQEEDIATDAVDGDEPSGTAILPRPPGPGLNGFATQVKSWFVERKCRHLSVAQGRRYALAIGRVHRAAVAWHGVAVVVPVFDQARQSAAQFPCGPDSLLLVKAGFADTLRAP